MTRPRGNSPFWLALGLGGWCAAAFAQISADVPTGPAGTQGRRTEADILSGLAGTPSDPNQPILTGAAGTPPEGLLQEAQQASDGLFRSLNPRLTRDFQTAGGKGQASATLPLTPQISVPLLEWQARPEDAQIQLGRFYLHFRALSLSVLASDNVDQSEVNRRFGSISIVRLELATYIQVLQNLRLAFGTTVGWLPFRNEIGFNDPLADLSFDAGLSPLASFQLSYEIPVGRWDVIAADQFFVQTGSFGAGSRFGLLNRGADSLEDRAGRYAFTVQQSPGQPGSDFNTRRATRGLEYHNVASVSATRVLPTSTRLTLGFQRDDIWYSRSSAGLPSYQNTATATLESERDDLRLKPFGSYTARNQSTTPGWGHEARAGVRGPLTPNLDFLGDVGYFWSDGVGRDGVLWRARLTHTPRESTRHSIEYARTVGSFPVSNIGTTLEYRLQQTIGPELLGEVALARSTFNTLDAAGAGFEEDRIEGRLTWQLNPRASLRAGVAYSDLDSFTPGAVDYQLLTGRLEYFHQLREKLSGSLIFQHERRNSSLALDSYYENLVTLTLRQEF